MHNGDFLGFATGIALRIMHGRSVPTDTESPREKPSIDVCRGATTTLELPWKMGDATCGTDSWFDRCTAPGSYQHNIEHIVTGDSSYG